MLSRSWMRNRCAFSPVIAFPELLERPVRRGMGGEVEVTDSARTHFHDHEDVQDSKARRHGDKEIAGEKGWRVIANKRRPTLRRGALSGSWVIRHVASNRPRRDPNPQL